MNKIDINVNGSKIQINSGLTILQACLENNIDVPSFCYHGELGFAGNCRMCLVEISGAPKPIISCIFPATDGLVINTDSASVKKARETVIEFLLLNHPLDCPICDQAGECDLQELSYIHGSSNSRSLYFFREAVDDVNFNVSSVSNYSILDKITKKGLKSKSQVSEYEQVINPYMSRCILCTKCLRYERNISGVSILGVFGRGSGSQIRVLDRGTFLNELSGNTIDLCPVGALTSKNYSFKGRPWDLINNPHIDIFDNYGTLVEIGYKNGAILRIAPRLENVYNGAWISDKIRYGHDAFQINRLYKNVNFYFQKKQIFDKHIEARMLKRHAGHSVYISTRTPKLRKCVKARFHRFQKKFFLKNAKNLKQSCIFLNTTKLFINFENPLTILEGYSIKSLNNFFNNGLQSYTKTFFSIIDNIPSFMVKRLTFNKKFSENLLLLNLDLRVTNPVLNSKLFTLNTNGLLNIYNYGFYNYSNLLNKFFFGSTESSFLKSFLKGFNKEILKLKKKKTKVFFDGSFSLLTELTFVNLDLKFKNFEFQYLPRYQNVLNTMLINLKKNHKLEMSFLKEFSNSTIFLNIGGTNNFIQNYKNIYNVFNSPFKDFSLKENSLYLPKNTPYESFYNTLLVGGSVKEFLPVLQKKSNNKNSFFFEKLFYEKGFKFLYLSNFFKQISKGSVFFCNYRNLKEFSINFYKIINYAAEGDASFLSIYGKQSPFLRKNRQLKYRFRNNFGNIF